jgi:hypothetical protein
MTASWLGRLGAAGWRLGRVSVVLGAAAGALGGCLVVPAGGPYGPVVGAPPVVVEAPVVVPRPYGRWHWRHYYYHRHPRW